MSYSAQTAVPSEGLSLHRRDRRRGTLITLAGEIDLGSAPRLLDAFLDATWRAIAAGGRLRLENPCPIPGARVGGRPGDQ